jgi:hypothetical protein
MLSLPIPRLTPGDPYFDGIVPRAARLSCTRPEFADLWREVMGSEWTLTPRPPLPQGEGEENYPAVEPEERQRLRDEIDALVANLYGLTRDEFDHILGTFPLVFPDTDAGRARRAALLAVYDAIHP